MIKGQGWINQKKYGCLKHKWLRGYSDLKSLYNSLQPEIFKYPVANFLRFDAVAKFAAISIALALFDAKISYAQGIKQDIDILGTNSHGAQETNLAYFTDYIVNGRTLSRGNLFIYTLPSSFLAEAAIHFGLTGKLLYLGFPGNAQTASLKYALNMLKTKTQKTVLLVNASSTKADCLVLQKTK